MGTGYIFECPQCMYTTMVSNGRDWGMRAAVLTVSCPTCKEVMDLTVNEEIPFEKKKDKKIKDLRCLECNGPVKKWTWGPCPKCGSNML